MGMGARLKGAEGGGKTAKRKNSHMHIPAQGKTEPPSLGELEEREVFYEVRLDLVAGALAGICASRAPVTGSVAGLIASRAVNAASPGTGKRGHSLRVVVWGRLCRVCAVLSHALRGAGLGGPLQGIDPPR